MTYLMATNTDYEKGRLTGAHSRFLELAKGLSKDNKVIIISRKIPQLENEKNIIFYHINDNDSRLVPDHIAAILKISRKSRKVKQRECYDTAISFTPFISIAFKMGGIKNIVSLFREDLIGYHKIIGTNKLKIFYYKLIEILAVRCSKKIIVQCHDDKRSLIARTRKFDNKIENKVDIQINNANASWMNMESYGHADNAIPNILLIGEFSNLRKGHHLLLAAATRLYDEGYDFTVSLAGDGPDLPKYIEKYKHYSRISFLGKIKVAEHLGKADFLFVPSLMDSCPNTVLEALNAGVAVYGSNIGGIADLLVEQEYLFDPTVDATYDFLKHVLDSKRYVDDRIKQRKRKEELCFDWAYKIKVLIDE